MVGKEKKTDAEKVKDELTRSTVFLVAGLVLTAVGIVCIYFGASRLMANMKLEKLLKEKKTENIESE